MHLVEELKKYKFKSNDDLIKDLIADGFNSVDVKFKAILKNLNQGNPNPVLNHISIDSLNPDHIFDEASIKKLCINYRLRFLNSSYYKANFPEKVPQSSTFQW